MRVFWYPYVMRAVWELKLGSCREHMPPTKHNFRITYFSPIIYILVWFE